MDQILKEEKNVMLRENQYWIIISKSEEDFMAAVKESDIPINSNVLLSVREESTSENTLSFRFPQKDTKLQFSSDICCMSKKLKICRF